ncbi:hypothetical protein ACHAW6_015985 [Cyclotella cf. meneghiniana]
MEKSSNGALLGTVETGGRECEHRHCYWIEKEEAVKHLDKLPSTEKVVRYLHAAVGFPPKATWIKAIRAGNYDTCLMIKVKNVNKYFPESDETQKGHMQQTKQGIG